MNNLKKIQRNCKHATFLIEKKQVTRLSISEKIELKIHLIGCSVCRLFQRQSIVINKMVKHFFTKQTIELDNAFKNKLQNQIEEKLKKN